MPANAVVGRFFRSYRGDRQLPNDDDDKKGTSVVVYASCSIGEMADWLKANPTFSMDDYLWKISVPFAKIMQSDQTSVAYLSEKAANEFRRKTKPKNKNNGVYDDPSEFAAAIGIPIL